MTIGTFAEYAKKWGVSIPLLRRLAKQGRLSFVSGRYATIDLDQPLPEAKKRGPVAGSVYRKRAAAGSQSPDNAQSNNNPSIQPKNKS